MEKVKEFIVKNKIFMIVALLLIIAIAVLVGIKVHKDNVAKREQEAIEQTIEKYVKSLSELKVDEMLDTVDVKAAYAWSQCKGSTADEKEKEFKEQYDKTADNDVEAYKNSMESEINMLKTIYEKYLKDYKAEIVEIGKYEPVQGIDGLIKIKGKTVTSFNFEGQENKTETEVIFYLYNGKIVMMEDASPDKEETNTTDTGNVTEENVTAENTTTENTTKKEKKK